MHTGHDQPRHSGCQQCDGNGAKGGRCPQEELDYNTADQIAQRSEDSHACNISDGHGACTDQNRTQNTGNDLSQKLFTVAGKDTNEQCRQQRAAVGHLSDRQHKDGNRTFLQHSDEVRVNQRSCYAHGIQRSAAQLFGNTIGHEHRHEIERYVCQLTK